MPPKPKLYERADLPSLFPNASASFLAANCQPSGAKLERGAGNALLEPGKAQKRHSGKLEIRVISHRRRLLDEDNLAEKFHVDALRYAGIIDDDNPAACHIVVTQEKVSSKEKEHTEILIYTTI